MKTPAEILRHARGLALEDEDGERGELRLLPPLSQTEVAALEESLPCPLPDEARELFSLCRGFEGVLESVDFSGGLAGGFGMEEVFPHAVPIAHDGFGNYWIVDLTSNSTSWGPIFYACHDAPVIVYQTGSLGHFIEEALRLGNKPWKSELDDVHEALHLRIWDEQPGMLTYTDCQQSGDPDLVVFSGSLGESFLVCDLRAPQMGDGFAWGRYGELRRFGDQRIFGCEIRKPFWRRFLTNLTGR